MGRRITMFRSLVYLTSLVLLLGTSQVDSANGLDPNLVGWWKLDEGSGTIAYDSSGNELNGTINGDPTWDSGSPYGKSAFLLFDGQGDLVDINHASNPVLELPLYSIALWFRVDPGATRSVVFSGYIYSGTEGTDAGVTLELREEGVLIYYHRHPFGGSNRERIYTTLSYDDGFWHHAAMVRESDRSMSLYIDGIRVGSNTDVTSAFDVPIRIVLGSYDHFGYSRCWNGAIDDVRVYNRALSQSEIEKLMIYEKASNPAPTNGSIVDQVEVALQWGQGAYASLHDVYFSDNRADVNNAVSADPIGPGEVYKARQPDISYTLTGLDRGRTYYWRIDEVDDVNIWRGDIWSFTVRSLTAFNPSPPDGAQNEDLYVDLTWSAGVGAKLHYVYFGTDWEAVNEADDTRGVWPEFKGCQKQNSFDPGTLAVGQTYYWRIDEVNNIDVKKGNVWSFTTTPYYYEVLTGNYSWVHDPVIIKQDDTYYVFYTAERTPFRTSTDMHCWSWGGTVWPSGPPAWTWEQVPDFDGNIWAPDICYFNGKYHLYYSISSFGSNHSCIGMATNTTLDPSDPDYEWVDSGGPVVRSYRDDNYNAIDPSVFIDEQGPETTYWMAFGSFWSGIKLTELDPATGYPVSSPPVLYSIADRSTTRSSAIEAPVIVYKNGYYYLFVSFGQCCQGVNSTYNVRFGRADNIIGPYFDRNGVSMMMGGGTQITFDSPRWKGPGHCDILLDDDGKDWLVHHAYDVEHNGTHYLRIRRLFWTANGWPTVTEPNAGMMENLSLDLTSD
jgi:arabinan endo-1,5-alpha-L-arabinosidase